MSNVKHFSCIYFFVGKVIFLDEIFTTSLLCGSTFPTRSYFFQNCATNSFPVNPNLDPKFQKLLILIALFADLLKEYSFHSF